MLKANGAVAAPHRVLLVAIGAPVRNLHTLLVLLKALLRLVSTTADGTSGLPAAPALMMAILLALVTPQGLGDERAKFV